MWFDIEPCDISFTLSSPFQLEHQAIINASPDRVFAILAKGERQSDWFQDFVACRWTSDEPHGVGSTREIQLKLLTVKERFVAWEPGHRLAFTITAITMPFVRQMLEDMQFETMGQRTRFRWTVHYTPSALTRLVHPIMRSMFDKMFGASTHHLTEYAGRYPNDGSS